MGGEEFTGVAWAGTNGVGVASTRQEEMVESKNGNPGARPRTKTGNPSPEHLGAPPNNRPGADGSRDLCLFIDSSVSRRRRESVVGINRLRRRAASAAPYARHEEPTGGDGSLGSAGLVGLGAERVGHPFPPS